jgi:enoyl-CoA hydratase/carnithine racemase
MSQPITTTLTDGGLMIVTIDSPPMNLYDEHMHLALRAAIDAAADPQVGAVLIEARGRVFTGGLDLNYLERLGGAAAAESFFVELIETVHRLERLTVPTVLSAHAVCLTWGFELALACDLIIASEAASFGMVERRFALTPAMGGIPRLAARSGIGRAREMMLTGDLYSATELAAWNAINLVLPADGYEAAARDYCERLATGPQVTHGAAKAILQAYVAGGISLSDDRSPAIAGPLHATEIHAELVSQFLQR